MTTTKLEILLTDVMTRQPHSLSPMDSLERAERFCRSYHIHHLPVVDIYGKVIGMISQSDLLKISYGLSLFRHRDVEQFNHALFASVLVRDVMSTDVITLNAEDTIADALAIFEQNLFHAIPVVENDWLVGIVTPLDLLRACF